MINELAPTDIATFEPYKQQLAEIKKTNADTIFDYETEKGRKEARSHIFKIRQSKAEVEKRRKEGKAPMLEQIEKWDAIAKEIMIEFEEMIDVHLVPVKEAEEREEERKAILRDKIKSIAEIGTNLIGKSSAELQTAISKADEFEIGEEYGDLTGEANRQVEIARSNLTIAHDAAIKSERQEAELKQLREEQARKDAEAAAEKKAREDREAEEQRKQDEQRKIEADERKKMQDALDRAEREKQEAIADRERAEKIAAEAEAKAKRDAEEAERIENQRIVDEVAEEKAKRKAEQDARKKRTEIHADIVKHFLPRWKEEDAILIADTITYGEVPHVVIQYRN